MAAAEQGSAHFSPPVAACRAPTLQIVQLAAVLNASNGGLFLPATDAPDGSGTDWLKISQILWILTTAMDEQAPSFFTALRDGRYELAARCGPVSA